MKNIKILALIAFIAILPLNSLVVANPLGLNITKISPTYSYSNTDFNFIMKIIGNGFTNGTIVDVYYSTLGITGPVVESFSVISATEMRVNLEIPFNTSEGFYNVKVTSPDKQTSYIKEGGLELKKKSSANYFYPVIFSVNPPTAPTGQERSITITGEQFSGDNPLVRLIKTDSPEYYDLDSLRINHQEIHATTPDNMVVGMYDLLVRGTGGYGNNQFIMSKAFVVESVTEEPVEEVVEETNNPPADDSSNMNLVNVPTPPTEPPNNIPSAYLFDYRASFMGQNGTIENGSDRMLTHVIRANRGSTIDMWIKFKNISSYQWWFKDPLDSDNIHEVRLGLTKDATSLFVHDSWISTNRLTKITQDIYPGDIATLNFKIYIPENTEVGNYKLSVGLVAEWITWLYDDIHWEIKVS